MIMLLLATKRGKKTTLDEMYCYRILRIRIQVEKNMMLEPENKNQNVLSHRPNL